MPSSLRCCRHFLKSTKAGIALHDWLIHFSRESRDGGGDYLFRAGLPPHHPNGCVRRARWLARLAITTSGRNGTKLLLCIPFEYFSRLTNVSTRHRLLRTTCPRFASFIDSPCLSAVQFFKSSDWFILKFSSIFFSRLLWFTLSERNLVFSPCLTILFWRKFVFHSFGLIHLAWTEFSSYFIFTIESHSKNEVQVVRSFYFINYCLDEFVFYFLWFTLSERCSVFTSIDWCSWSEQH